MITELDDLINVHFEDLISQSESAVSQLEAIAGDFHLKTVTRGILSILSASIITNRDSALAAMEVRDIMPS